MTEATAREAHLPFPHSGPSRASAPAPPPPLFCFHSDRQREARSKHNALRKTCGPGDPPAAPARDRDLRGPGVTEATCSLASAPRTRQAAPDAPLPSPPRLRRFVASLGRDAATMPGASGPQPCPLAGAASGRTLGRAPQKAEAPPPAGPPPLRPRKTAPPQGPPQVPNPQWPERQWLGAVPGGDWRKRTRRCFRVKECARWRRPWSYSAGLGAGDCRRWTWIVWPCW